MDNTVENLVVFFGRLFCLNINIKQLKQIRKDKKDILIRMMDPMKSTLSDLYGKLDLFHQNIFNGIRINIQRNKYSIIFVNNISFV